MRIANRKELVQITATYKPNIKTIKQVMYETGRLRQQIERNEKLTFGIVLNDDKSGDLGQKVIIDDKELQEFIDKCKAKDKGKKTNVAAKKPRKAKKAAKRVKKSKPKAEPKPPKDTPKISSSLSSLMDEVEGYGE